MILWSFKISPWGQWAVFLSVLVECSQPHLYLTWKTDLIKGVYTNLYMFAVIKKTHKIEWYLTQIFNICPRNQLTCMINIELDTETDIHKCDTFPKFQCYYEQKLDFTNWCDHKWQHKDVMAQEYKLSLYVAVFFC